MKQETVKLAGLLNSIGWRSSNDAQHTRLDAALDDIRELLRDAGRGELVGRDKKGRTIRLDLKFPDECEALLCELMEAAYAGRGEPLTDVPEHVMAAVGEHFETSVRSEDMILIALNADRATPTRKSECDDLQLIDERDKAEEAVSQSYYLVTGRSPEWSNNFGYDQALEDIKDAVNLYKAAIKSAPSATPAVAEAGDTWPTISLSKEQVEQVNKGLAMLADVPHPSPESGEPDPAKAEAGEKRFAESWAYLNDSEKCDNQHQEILFLRVAVRHLIAELRKGAGK